MPCDHRHRQYHMPYAAIIFDLDGTLADSLGDLADSMNEVLESMGHPTHPREPYRRFVGDGIVNLVRRALPAEVADQATVEEAVRRMQEVYARRWMDATVPYPGIPELLRELRALELKTAVLSNKPDGATKELVSRLFPVHAFDRVRGERPGIPLKPDPTSALDLLSDLGARPESVLYLGDTDTDMQTGRRAGMFTVGVTWGFRDENELRDSGAQRIIRDPLELLDVLTP
jgi:phosphoglycolate phosphatase